MSGNVDFCLLHVMRGTISLPSYCEGEMMQRCRLIPSKVCHLTNKRRCNNQAVYRSKAPIEKPSRVAQ